MVTYFVVLGFKLGKGGTLIADEPKEVHNGSDQKCVHVAKRLKEQRDGVIAFSRTGDMKTGDWDDAVVLWQDGIVPEDLFAMAS